VRGFADEVGRSMAEVALAWLLGRPDVSSILIGASRVEQLQQNVASLNLALSDDQRRRLDEVSALPMLSPHFIFDLPLQAIFGGQTVRRWSDRRPA
jgi:aryl-alcohol dehydrogenase-like predicted oxidoreductase